MSHAAPSCAGFAPRHSTFGVTTQKFGMGEPRSFGHPVGAAGIDEDGKAPVRSANKKENAEFRVLERAMSVSRCGLWRVPHGPPTRCKHPRCRKCGEKQHQSPVSSGSLAYCPVTPAVHITRHGMEVTEARNDVVVRRPAVTMRRPAQRFLAVDRLLEQDLAEGRQHRARGSLRDAGRPAWKLERGVIRLPGALITIARGTTRHLIVNPVTSHPGYRHRDRQKARQRCRNREKTPLHPPAFFTTT